MGVKVSQIETTVKQDLTKQVDTKKDCYDEIMKINILAQLTPLSQKSNSISSLKTSLTINQSSRFFNQQQTMYKKTDLSEDQSIQNDLSRSSYRLVNVLSKLNEEILLQ